MKALPPGKRGKAGLTARQEAFALHLAMGVSQAEAYRQAGYLAQGERVHQAASHLAKLGKVSARVAEISTARQRALLATATFDARKISEMLAEAFTDAKKWKQSGAQVAAAMGLAKVHGLLVDKTEDVTRRATRNPDAPIEIDVEHWVTEQAALLAPIATEPSQSPSAAPSAAPSAEEDAPAGHGAPLLEEPQPKAPEPQSPDEGAEPQSPTEERGALN